MPHGALFFDKTLLDDFTALLNRYKERELASPFRSTVPLLALVKDSWDVFREVLVRCQLPEDAALHFEYTQKVIRGRGKASHTDLMACSESSLALEAKWTEPRYPTVAEWLENVKGEPRTQEEDEEENSNREEVLAGWYGLLQSRAPRLAPLCDFRPAIYQMVHRAASACGRSAQPQLGYVKFKCASESHSHCTTYWDDLAELHKLLGSPSDFPFHLIEVEVTPTLAFDAVRNLKKGSEATCATIRTALLEAPLFEFALASTRSL